MTNPYYRPQDQPPSQYSYPAPPPVPPAQPYVIPPRQFNHGAHFIGDLCTLGLWIPFHILMWALHPRRPVLVTPDGKRKKL